jgi:hypothetical protein
VNAGTFNGLVLYLAKNSITVSVDSIYNALMQGYYGLSITGYQSAYGTSGLYGLPGALLIFNQDAGAPGSGGTLIAQLARTASGGGGTAGAGYLMLGDTASPQNQMVMWPGGLAHNSASGTTVLVKAGQYAVGSPTGFADSVAQAWCAKMYAALSGYHQLVT